MTIRCAAIEVLAHGVVRALVGAVLQSAVLLFASSLGCGSGATLSPQIVPSEGAISRPQATMFDWHCAFPAEAEKAKIGRAVVVLALTVAANGTVEKVDVANDPGYGFGAEAVRCAALQRFTPGVDASGSAVRARISVNVHFVR